MTGTIVALTLAYATVGVLALGLLLMTAAPLLLRVPVAVLVIGLMFVTYDAVGDLRGWPSDEMPPPRFRLYWGQVVEPDPMRGEAGSVFLWLTELDDANFPVGDPRAHRLPWSRELADQVQAALAGIAEGEEIAGEVGEAEDARPTAEQLAEEAEAADEAAQAGGGGAVGERVQGFVAGQISFGAAPSPVTPVKPD
jgi:hypothetical protein